MNPMLTGGIAGLAAGLIINKVAVFQVKRRTDDENKVRKVNNVPVLLAACVITAILFALIFGLNESIEVGIEYVLYISIALAIGVVDLDIKKIPNLSVLALMIVRTAAIIYALITGASVKSTVIPSVIGLAAAFILYQLPMLIGIPIGVGDVKFASAIGYCLGFIGFLQAAIVMALGLAILLIILKATGKGSMKTKVPMGPFLALGTIVTLLFPVLTGLSQQFPLL